MDFDWIPAFAGMTDAGCIPHQFEKRYIIIITKFRVNGINLDLSGIKGENNDRIDGVGGGNQPDDGDGGGQIT